MSEKVSLTLTQWQKLGNIPMRFLIFRVLGTALIISAIVFVWLAYPSFPIYVFEDPTNNQEPGPISENNVLNPTLQPTADATGLLPLNEAEALCAQHDMKPFPDRGRHRKVYDLFIVGTELDWTEIRLNELAPYVDYFVILEAEKTFTNHTKPKFFKKNWKHFSRFESQIIYHVLNDDAIAGYGAWDREHYQRNSLLTQVFPSLLGEKAPNMGDVIIVSDVDEIPRPETVEKLRNCEFPERTGIQSRFFLYSYQLHRTDMDWYHPQATFWQGEKTILPESLRMTGTSYQFPNAAWHCTTCFSTVAELVNKINSFSHQEWNKAEFKDPDAIVRRVRNGTDVFERGFPYERIEVDQLDAPEYLMQHKEKFAYLLNRDPPNANFRDYVPILDGDGYDRTENDDSKIPKLELP